MGEPLHRDNASLSAEKSLTQWHENRYDWRPCLLQWSVSPCPRRSTTPAGTVFLAVWPHWWFHPELSYNQRKTGRWRLSDNYDWWSTVSIKNTYNTCCCKSTHRTGNMLKYPKQDTHHAPYTHKTINQIQKNQQQQQQKTHQQQQQQAKPNRKYCTSQNRMMSILTATYDRTVDTQQRWQNRMMNTLLILVKQRKTQNGVKHKTPHQPYYHYKAQCNTGQIQDTWFATEQERRGTLRQ